MGKYRSGFAVLLLFIGFQVFAQTRYSNIPTLHITTTNNRPVTDKYNYVKGNLVVKSQNPSEELSMVTEIRLRGNATYWMEKKSFRIKLDKKTNLLNLPAKERSWVLLANYADKTLMRNALAFKIGEILGFDFTPSIRFVDVVLNGTFIGNYFLTDQANVGPNRVNINEQDGTETTEPAISGGYLLEQAGDPSGEPVWFGTSKGLKLVVKSPDSEVINQKQIEYIKNYISNFENKLFSPDFKDPVKGYRAIVDTVSLINWYVACELTGNSDSFWSTYMYKKRSDDKLYFGPLWDFDIAFNNDNRLGDAIFSLMREAAWDPKAWITQMWLDEWFREAVWRRWKEVAADNLLENLCAFIDETAREIDASQKLNFNTWKILNRRIYLETFVFNTYKEGVDYLKYYMAKRIDFLTESFGKVETEKPSDPFNPYDGYYTIQNKRSMNLIVTDQNSVNANAPLVMWEPLEDNDAQLWSVNSIGYSLYHIINKHSGLAMTGNGHGNNLIQAPLDPYNEAQQWYITPVLTGNLYGIVNRKTGNSVNNSGGGLTNGTNSIEWTNNIHGSMNQQYYFNESSSTAWMPPEVLFSQVDIYPNPAEDFVQIKLTVTDQQDIRFALYNLQGVQQYQEAHSFALPGNYTVTIPTIHLNSGLYFIHMDNPKGEKVIKKLIIKN